MKLYFKSDVFLSTDKFEKFSKISVEEFDINPLNCVNIPRYSWQCGLNLTDISLQTLQDKK